jgi:hypothetical protein
MINMVWQPKRPLGAHRRAPEDHGLRLQLSNGSTASDGVFTCMTAALVLLGGTPINALHPTVDGRPGLLLDELSEPRKIIFRGYNLR